MDFNQIQELIRMLSKHKISEFILSEGDFKLVIRNQAASEPPITAVPAPIVMPAPQHVVQTIAAPAPTPAPAQSDVPASSAEKPAPAPAGSSDDSARYVAVKSPMVGTFYRSPSPDKPAFVKVGDGIDVGQTVCIIEAMKLFNEIESEIKGKIVKVLVEDGSPVEYEQALFLVDPA